MVRKKAIKSTDVLMFDGKQCIRLYCRLLKMARADGVRFTLNSGYRSWAKQAQLYALYLAGRGPLAARPGSSTHNKKSWLQGLDINATDGGVTRLRAWLEHHGLHFDLTVPGESWHLNARENYTTKINAMWVNHLKEERHKAAIKARKRRA